jgi:hypothetical protein
MAQFYFHTESDTRRSDTVGEGLPSLEDARTEAVRLCAGMMQDGAREFWGTKPWTMTVTDETGLIFFTLEVHGQDAPVATPPRPGP